MKSEVGSVFPVCWRERVRAKRLRLPVITGPLQWVTHPCQKFLEPSFKDWTSHVLSALSLPNCLGSRPFSPSSPQASHCWTPSLGLDGLHSLPAVSLSNCFALCSSAERSSYRATSFIRQTLSVPSNFRMGHKLLPTGFRITALCDLALSCCVTL